MKIGVVCVPSAGGSGILATELGREMAKRGHEVHFITSSRPHRLRAELEPGIFFHEVQALHYPVFEHTPFMLALAARMAEVYRRHKLDLFHVHYAVPHAAAAIFARAMLAPCHAPIVTTLHGTDITLVGQDPSYKQVVHFCLEKSEIVTAVSDWLKDVTESIFSPSRPVQRIHNFADPDVFKPQGSSLQRSKWATAEQTIYLHASNFRPVKRVQDCVRAFASAVAQGVDGVLVLAGDGPELPGALDLAERLGVFDRLRVLGVVEDVSQILPLADVVLFPSDGESFGLVPLESLLCEVPVVGAHAGGLPEVVEHQVSGFLHAVGDIDAMASACVVLAKDPVLRQAMGKRGRELSIARFTPQAIIPQYEELYRQSILQRTGCPQGQIDLPLRG